MTPASALSPLTAVVAVGAEEAALPRGLLTLVAALFAVFAVWAFLQRIRRLAVVLVVFAVLLLLTDLRVVDLA